MPEFATQSIGDFIAEANRMRSQEELYPAPARSPDSRVQLGRLSITHEAVMDWLLVNPGKGQMRLCAEYFGFTRAWLSSMVHSDAFQAKLRDKQEEHQKTNIIPLRDQINGVAQRAVERLGEKVEVIEDPRVLMDVADKMLHRLGYAPKVDMNPAQVNNTQINQYAVSPELLATARENAKKGDLNAGTGTTLPSPEGLQRKLECEMGETFISASSVLDETSEAAEDRREVSGNPIREESAETPSNEV